MIALRGRLERVRPEAKGSENGPPPAATAPPPSSSLPSSTWKWSGQWAFGQSISEADVAISRSAVGALPGAPGAKQLFPFSYTWEAAVDPFDVRVPSEEIAFKEAQEKLKQAETEASANITTTTTATTEVKSQTNSPTAPSLGEKTGDASASKAATAGSAAAEGSTATASVGVTTTTGGEKTTTDDSVTKSASTNKQSSTTAATNLAMAALPPVSTFACDNFTDASTKYPDQCPTGGRWKGSFDTAAQPVNARKSIQLNPPTIPISESFSLFLNATPPAHARTQFLDEEDDSIISNAASQLSPGHIHARGMGENQYGIFELVGSLHLESGVLQLQRLYVQIPEPAGSRGRRSPRGRRRSVRLPMEGGDSQARGTRKRSLSWKRRSMMEGGEEDPAAGKGKRQRKRASSTGSSTTMEGGSLLSGYDAPPGSLGDAPDIVYGASEPDWQMLDAGVQSMPQQPQPQDPNQQQIPQTTATYQKKWPLLPLSIPGKSEGVKRSSSSTTGSKKRAGAAAPALGRGSSAGPVLKLPPAGDPAKARWRAAHFLYYHRPSANDETTAAAGGGAAPGGGGSTNVTKSVVYEGELFNGKRHGRGVCLYDNDMIYEGEWRYDKEHGYGSLYSGDRKRVIYEGEWERGRIHGIGKYYYGDDNPKGGPDEAKGGKKKRASPAAASPKGAPVRSNCRYEGEFRENLRHGNGIYVLPNGSVYEGNWREGAMSGRGIFRWPDGSVYDGDWKDGRRNGQGLLHASDGFTYDGNWVQNCMEGRGSATYPSGQQYHGMFSNGKREGRGTIIFPNGAVYEGRFRDDAVDGQGTMKIRHAVVVPKENEKPDFMIPVSFQSDMGHIHRKAGFTVGGK